MQLRHGAGSDAMYCRKWRVVSHPLNANPFPASLLNYKAKLRLHEVTVDNQTFIEQECSFETEHEVRKKYLFAGVLPEAKARP